MKKLYITLILLVLLFPMTSNAWLTPTVPYLLYGEENVVIVWDKGERRWRCKSPYYKGYYRDCKRGYNWGKYKRQYQPGRYNFKGKR